MGLSPQESGRGPQQEPLHEEAQSMLDEMHRNYELFLSDPDLSLLRILTSHYGNSDPDDNSEPDPFLHDPATTQALDAFFDRIGALKVSELPEDFKRFATQTTQQKDINYNRPIIANVLSRRIVPGKGIILSETRVQLPTAEYASPEQGGPYKMSHKSVIKINNLIAQRIPKDLKLPS
jgi:hypothetical protein